MIITKLKGGLGNQMFQYAAGFALAARNKTEQKIDVSGYDDIRVINSDTPRKFALSIFNISSAIALSDEIAAAKYPFGVFSKGMRFLNQKILRKNYLDFHPELFKKISSKITAQIENNKNNETKKPVKSFYLDGFFQSEKNFADVAEQIRQEFTFKKELFDERVQQIAEVIQKSNSVSIHIRRGDYVSDPKTLKYHGLCSAEYYYRAIDLIKQKIAGQQNTDTNQTVTFYIFSDDSKWVEESFIPKNFAQKTNVVNVSAEYLKDHEEMYLMSQCRHNIIANSSFSWWSAWLNKNSDKIVIAPKTWTNKNPDPHPNIIPEKWIKA